MEHLSENWNTKSLLDLCVSRRWTRVVKMDQFFTIKKTEHGTKLAGNLQQTNESQYAKKILDLILACLSTLCCSAGQYSVPVTLFQKKKTILQGEMAKLLWTWPLNFRAWLGLLMYWISNYFLNPQNFIKFVLTLQLITFNTVIRSQNRYNKYIILELIIENFKSQDYLDLR